MRHHPGDFKSIGCEVGKLGSAMSRDQLAKLADRHKPARGSNAAKVGGSSERLSKTRVAPYRRNSWRYSVGLTPHIRRNTRAKCCCVLKPQPTATSKTRASAARNISVARS
jgi:RNase P subunit RPR2